MSRELEWGAKIVDQLEKIRAGYRVEGSPHAVDYFAPLANHDDKSSVVVTRLQSTFQLSRLRR